MPEVSLKMTVRPGDTGAAVRYAGRHHPFIQHDNILRHAIPSTMVHPILCRSAGLFALLSVAVLVPGVTAFSVSSVSVSPDLLHPGDAVLVKASRGQHLEQVLELWKERALALVI